jgi:hypothetical protein
MLALTSHQKRGRRGDPEAKTSQWYQRREQKTACLYSELTTKGPAIYSKFHITKTQREEKNKSPTSRPRIFDGSPMLKTCTPTRNEGGSAHKGQPGFQLSSNRERRHPSRVIAFPLSVSIATQEPLEGTSRFVLDWFSLALWGRRPNAF